jgi:hypothetical protein
MATPIPRLGAGGTAFTTSPNCHKTGKKAGVPVSGTLWSIHEVDTTPTALLVLMDWRWP